MDALLLVSLTHYTSNISSCIELAVLPPSTRSRVGKSGRSICINRARIHHAKCDQKRGPATTFGHFLFPASFKWTATGPFTA